jgi:DNA-binding MarR family transcriptional regulator
MRPDESDVHIPLPALLRAARGSFALAIRQHLVEDGIHDLPPNGAYILGGLTMSIHGGQLFREIGLGESSRVRLLQLLLERDFVVPGPGVPRYDVPDLELTDKGRRAAEAAHSGINAVSDELATMLSPQELSSFRTALIALIDIKERAEGHHDHDHEHDHPHVHDHE